jgi:hypothetical protein
LNAVAKARADARERGRVAVERATETVRASRRALEPDARRLLDAAAKRAADKRGEVRREAQAAREDAAGRVRGLRTRIAATVRQDLRPAEDGLAVARSALAAAPALCCWAARSRTGRCGCGGAGAERAIGADVSDVRGPAEAAEAGCRAVARRKRDGCSA